METWELGEVTVEEEELAGVTVGALPTVPEAGTVAAPGCVADGVAGCVAEGTVAAGAVVLCPSGGIGWTAGREVVRGVTNVGELAAGVDVG